MKALISELRRRKVFRVAVAYAVVAWLLIQIIVSVESPLNLPDWADTFLIVTIVAGFPITLILAWVFDVTPAGVMRTDAEPPANESPASTADAPEEKSIAVLPFVNMSSDPEQEYFSDGISEELLNQLTKIGGLHVAGRTSSFYFKGKNEDLRTIGEKLNVAHILEGSVRKAGNRIRITAQLIKVADGYHLWSENFDRELDDIFAIQDETAKAVAEALSVTLGVTAPGPKAGGTKNVEAYDAYLVGIAKYRAFGRLSLQQGARRLEDAVALDPEFGDAWGWLAETYDMLSHSFDAENAEELARKSEEAASRAVESAVDSPAAHRAAALLAIRNREWVAGERHWQKALDVAPGDADINHEYGRFLLYVGRPTEALRYCETAVDIDPLSLFLNLSLAIVYQMNGDRDTARRQFQRALQLPGSKHFLRALMLVFAMESRDRALMRECLEDMLATPSGDMSASERITEAMSALIDDPDRAMIALQEFDANPDYDDPLGRLIIAVWAAYFGEPGLALKQYQRLQDSRAAAFFTMWRPIQKETRQLPEFKDVLSELGLVEYWRNTGKWSDFVRPIGDKDFEVYR